MKNVSAGSIPVAPVAALIADRMIVERAAASAAALFSSRRAAGDACQERMSAAILHARETTVSDTILPLRESDVPGCHRQRR